MKHTHPEFYTAIVVAMSLARTIAEARGYTHADVLRQCRKRPLCHLRWEIWYAVKEATGLGCPTLGKVFMRDVQTIYHGIKQHTRIITGLSPLH